MTMKTRRMMTINVTIVEINAEITCTDVTIPATATVTENMPAIKPKVMYQNMKQTTCQMSHHHNSFGICYIFSVGRYQ